MSRHILAALALLAGLAGAVPADAQRASTNGAGFVPNGWCKGNGNPHAAECPIFAPGSTAPTTHTSNQPIQTTNQLPTVPQQPTLPVIIVTPLAPQTITGYAPGPQAVRAPDVTGYSPGVVIAPNPPQIVTGYSPGPQQVPTPSFTGYAPYRVPPQPQPQQVPSPKPGHTAYPDYVGPRDPNTGYPVVTANPPQTITGYAPYRVPPQPQPQQVPSPKPGYAAYPDYVGPRDPNTGYPVVTANPPQTITGYAPYMVPPQPPQQQTPVAVPQPQPYNVPTPLQVDVPRPRPLPPQGNPPPTSQATVVITPQGGGSHVGADLITAQSGRQAPTAVPVFEAKGTGDRWHCVASGHHVRKVFDDGGNEVYAGSLPGIAIQVVPIIRDVPAWHDLSSECIISVREHPKAKQARR